MMSSKVAKNNQVDLVGKVVSDYTYSHELFGEGFYLVDIEVERLSGTPDLIPILVSERLIEVKNNSIGKLVFVKGQFRSYNRIEDGKNRLVLTVFAKEIMFDITETTNPNSIFLDGYICKKPVYRTTPFGREITDILLAVNRAYNKSDYIPCICWGRNAKFAQNFEVGENVHIWGRIQSREYQKKIGEDQFVTKVAYEVSISKMEKAKENSEEEIED
ncbi:MAG: single-strand binding protein/Primosomal replication protein n [Clostridiales bacterium]|jgi:single-stranded DNA-binding protein|nr:single-strand binding protein/Primosomal replication protein n [Clostridiales bacterium]